MVKKEIVKSFKQDSASLECVCVCWERRKDENTPRNTPRSPVPFVDFNVTFIHPIAALSDRSQRPEIGFRLQRHGTPPQPDPDERTAHIVIGSRWSESG